MSQQIDQVFGMDWTESTYIGDGVYMMDATHRQGVPSVAVRTDKDFRHFVIFFEYSDFETMVTKGRAIFEGYMPKKEKG